MKSINKKTLGITQTLLLVVAIFAFAFTIGSSIEVVSAAACEDGGWQCADMTFYSCSVPFEPLLCDGSSVIQCCKGTIDTLSQGTQTVPTEEQQTQNTLNTIGTVLGIGTSGTALANQLGLISLPNLQSAALANAAAGTGTAANAAAAASSTAANVGPGVFGSALPSGFWGHFTASFGENVLSSGTGFWSWAGNIAAPIAYAAIAAVAYRLILGALGAGDRNLPTLLQSGVAVGAALALYFAEIGIFASFGGIGLVVLGVLAIFTALNYQDFSQDTFSYQVGLWQPADGGENCEECNDLDFGCSEYQCRSYGKSCGIINPGSDFEKCVWLNPDDNWPPELTPLNDSLPSAEFYYDPFESSPTVRGAEIIYEPNLGDKGGCIPPFTELTFGVETNEPAECKIDLEKKDSFEEMISYMNEGTASVYEHTLTIPASGIPSQEMLNQLGVVLENGNEYLFFIRCKDTNGNANVANYLMEFCVDDGPDTNAPLIKGTNYQNPSYILFNTSTAPLTVYTNEPVTCKWDFEDYDYEQMNNEMNYCAPPGTYISPISYDYGCEGELTGIKDYEENKYYIKCKDLANNTNKDPYIQSLIGSLPLEIKNITVNDMSENILIKDSTNTIKAKLKIQTSAGANEGNAICEYSTNNVSFIQFYNDGDFDYNIENTQNLYLPEGTYDYYFRCYDQASNLAYGNISFEIDVDNEAPQIIRTYYEQNKIKLITDEEAECVYTNFDCDYAYEDGIAMTTVSNINHFTTWNKDNTLYVKCKDNFGNQPPLQSDCSIIVRPFENF